MTQAPGENAGSAEQVRPQRPRPAPPQPTLAEPPTAWQRSSRGEATVFVLLNLGLLTCACLLFSKVTTGRYLFITGSGPVHQQSLGQMMLGPVSIYLVPAQGLVLAMLLGTFVCGLILTAQFFGRGWAILGVIPMVVLAHLPLLGLAMLGAVWLATVPLFGIVNRFVRGVVALVFPVAAMWVSTWRTEVLSETPMELAYLNFPWVAAVLGSGLVMLLFWVVARLLKYWILLGTFLLAFLVAGTSSLFVYGVGMDELAFRLLHGDCGLANPYHFRSRPLTERINATADERLSRDRIDQPTEAERAGYRAEARTWLKMRIDTELIDSQALVGRACADFLARHPTSRYVPYVLFLLARSQDMRVDLAAISREEKVIYYEDFPSQDGQDNWARVLVYYPDHPLAVVAQVRLAQWQLAHGDIDRGYRLMRKAHQRLKAVRATGTPRAPFGIRPRDPEIAHLVKEQTRQVPYWLWLIEKNRGEGRLGDEPLAKFFALDPRHPDYLKNLELLQSSYAASRLADNLDLLTRLQKSHGPTRVQSLLAFIRSRSGSDSDARWQAMAELANLLVKQNDPEQTNEARQLWRQLLESGETLFAEEAAAGLAAIGQLEPPSTTRSQ